MNYLYLDRYESSEARALHLTIKRGYGNQEAMAKDLGVSRQYISGLFQERIPIRYAGYLGRKFSFHPAILAYEDYLLLDDADNGTSTYQEFLNYQSFFDKPDQEYILCGEHILDPAKFLRTHDRGIRK